MTEPIETFHEVEVKFAQQPVPVHAERVDIYQSGLMRIKTSQSDEPTWYPPDKAPIVKEP